jgi:hypothetical protein
MLFVDARQRLSLARARARETIKVAGVPGVYAAGNARRGVQLVIAAAEGAAGGVRDQFRAIGSGFAARQSAGDRSSWGLRSLAILACGKRGISGDVNCATMPLTGYV